MRQSHWAEARLIKVHSGTTATYTYNARGQRVEEWVATVSAFLTVDFGLQQ
ncbi:MAG: hypothetical protein ACRD3D_14430 [Terriglobia bacterium]